MSAWRVLLSGASRYLGTVAVGVLLAPVLPDVVVDLFGGGPGWGDALLRIGALAVVVGLCGAVYLRERRVAQRRSHRAVLTGIDACKVLVLPVGFTCVYRPPGERTGRRSIPEWLIDTCGPSTVVLVASRQITDVESKLGRGLDMANIRWDCLTLTDVSDARLAVSEAERRIPEMLAALGVTGQRTYVDTTGGNVIMSLAMLRVGVVLGTECTYLYSETDKDGPIPNTQVGRAFDPAALFGPAA